MFNSSSAKFISGFVIIILIAVVSWFVVSYFSPEAQQERETTQY
jgi:hypothetical protein